MHPVARGFSKHPVRKVRISKHICERKPAAWGSNQNDAASSSQVWLADAMMSERARKLAAASTNQVQNFQEHAKKLAADRVSRAYARHLEKLCSNLRQQLEREPEDRMEYLNVNTMTWGIFSLVTKQAAILSNDCLRFFFSYMFQ